MKELVGRMSSLSCHEKWRCIYIFEKINIFPQVRESCKVTHPAITCSKSAIETLEQGVKYVQS